MNKLILLADDEKDIVEFLKYNLEAEGFEVLAAHDGEEALLMMKYEPDLVLLDIMMPKMDGIEVCRRIRADKETASLPVIFLTAKSAEKDEITGLETGANDYITKPISPKILIARVKSHLRIADNMPKKALAKKIQVGPIVVDRNRYIVLVDGVETVFPRKEFELLYYLSSNPGMVLSREALLKEIWGTDVFVVDRTVDVHIRKVREKLGEYADMIETVKGVGYRFKALE